LLVAVVVWHIKEVLRPMPVMVDQEVVALEEMNRTEMV
jgi:hypothetical protein